MFEYDLQVLLAWLDVREEAGIPSGGDTGRQLIANEIAAAQREYGNQIDYSKPRVYYSSYIPFQNVPMAPDGNLYFPMAKGCPDLTACTYPNGTLMVGDFIHEMGHVLQHQQGVNVLARGLFSKLGEWLSFGRYNPYFVPPGTTSPTGLGIEAQAEFHRNRYCEVYVCL
jgi:hypothetical protein